VDVELLIAEAVAEARRIAGARTTSAPMTSA